MLRYKTETRPGLVALYDIRPGNGAGPFLQPWSQHGATKRQNTKETEYNKCNQSSRNTKTHLKETQDER